MSARSTIREVRAVVFATTATGDDAAQAWEQVQATHAAKLEGLRALQSVEHIGPPLQSGNGERLHPFAHVLVGIALGAEIEWQSGNGKWGPILAEHALRDISKGCARPDFFRVKP